MKHQALHFLLLFLCSFISSRAQISNAFQENQSVIISKADSLINLSKFKNALEVLKTTANPNLEILLRAGQCESRLGLSSAAIRSFRQVLQLDTINVIALNQLGQLHSRNGDYYDALDVYMRLMLLDTANSFYIKQIGNMNHRLEHKEEALKWYTKALELNPEDVESAYELGDILLELKQFSKLDSLVTKALVIDPSYRPVLSLKAKSAFEQADYNLALEQINMLCMTSDTTVQYARMMSVCYFNLKHYEDLMMSVKFLLRNNYQYDWMFYYMGVATRELGNIPSSIQWFDLAIQYSVSSNIKTYYSNLAKSFELMNDHENAIRAYKEAYNYSGDGIFLYHLARNYDVYYKDKSTALLYYEKYLQSDDTIKLTRNYARQRLHDAGKF